MSDNAPVAPPAQATKPRRPKNDKRPADAKSPRRLSREFALQGVYQWLLAQHYVSDLISDFRQVGGFGRADARLFEVLLRGIVEHHATLAEALTPHVDRPWHDVTPIEKSILFIGGYELVHMPETPVRVVINESIELAKTFGGTDAHKYVNGVLDKLAALARAAELQRK
jgi:transcription antitermination protein NusB